MYIDTFTSDHMLHRKFIIDNLVDVTDNLLGSQLGKFLLTVSMILLKNIFQKNPSW
jgi:hypothetical protein